MSDTTNEALGDLVGSASATMLLGVIEALRVAGFEPQKAVRLATMVVLEGSLGRGVWDLVGIPGSTARRWRQQIREAIASGNIPEEVPVEFQHRVLDLIVAATKERL